MNRLANSPSSYLRRAADEPIDWYPWGDEAFERARRENKPVLLSIGAVWCHWCHVMAHDTWYDPDTVKIINERFIAVKVDRDDRPEIDRRFQEAVQALTGHGGWPLTVFLTPDRQPFYGGTYYPGKAKYGMPAFSDVLTGIADIYQKDRGSVERIVNDLTQRYVFAYPRRTPLDPHYLSTVVSLMHDSFDPLYGGFGTSQKFPYTESLLFLLQYFESSGDRTAWEMVEYTLKQMAGSGTYDHIGGGFHRYATDRAWRVPHFEKMLNDNALLLSAYLEAYQLSGSPVFRSVAEEIIGLVFRDLLREPAGFASSIDADVDGREGAYFVWTEPEIVEALGADKAPEFMKLYHMTGRGNIGHGENALYVVGDYDRSRFADERRKLLEARDRRKKPYVDMSIHTSWTALMVTSLTRAFNVLGDRRCLDYAVRTADFVMSAMFRNGTLYRTFTDKPVFPGYLEDYACMIEALLELFNTTQDDDYLRHAISLTRACEDKFFDREHGGYFFVQAEDRDAAAQDKPVTDFSVPGSNPQMAMNLIKLNYYTGDQTYIDRAQALVEGFFEMCQQYPLGHGTFFVAMDYLVNPPEQVAIVATGKEKEGRELVDLANSKLIKKITLLDYGQFKVRPDVFDGKTTAEDRPTAYFCRDSTCTVPMTDKQDILEMLKRPRFAGK